LIPTVNNLAYPRTGSFIRAISSEKRGLDGKRVHGALIDEVQEQPTSVVVDKVRAGTKGRRNALIVMTGNSGYDRHSVWWSIHEYSVQVLEGVVQNDSWFAYICQLDACDSCVAAGKQQPSETCPTCDDWRIEGPHWLKVNPNLGVSLPWEYLREQVREAIAMPSKQNTVKRLNFCIWTEQVTVWIPIDRWTRCQSERVTAESLEKRECYLGCDLSAKIDLSSVQAVFPRPLAAAAPLVAGRDGQEITRAIDVLSYFWMPELTLQQRAREDNMPYVEWRNAGYLFATAGALIDHDAIADFIIQVLAKRFRIRGIGVDQAGATAFVTRLQRHFGDELVTEVPQGFKMLSGPSKTLEALVMSENVAHDGNPVMAMCVGNMGKEENSWQEIRPVKLSPRKRIDGGVALIDGICTMERTDPGQVSAYSDGHGLMVC
jgi:phage terminase large subunit-like protein